MDQLTDYTYEDYKKVYAVMGGKTSHFLPALGHGTFYKDRLTNEQFQAKISRLLEISRHDDEWLMQQENYIDIAENEAWELLHLRSDLFIIEIERACWILDAMDDRGLADRCPHCGRDGGQCSH